MSRPDEGRLQAMGVRANKPREALREAEKLVAVLDIELQIRAEALPGQYQKANAEANQREDVMNNEITSKAYLSRRKKALASVADLCVDANNGH
jgi:hypothetical protein